MNGPEFIQSLRRFLAEESPPDVVAEADERGDPPIDLLNKLGDLGYLAVGLPERWGGAGTMLDLIYVQEELGYHNLALGAIAGRTAYACQMLLHFGTQDLQQQWIPKLVGGEAVFSVAITEPDAGSDAASLRTRAALEGDEFILNGEKIYTTSAGYADLAMVAVRTENTEVNRNGISTLLVGLPAQGFETQRLRTLGDWGGGTYSVALTDVRVPRSNLLGELNGGWRVLTDHLARERAMMAARCVGAIRRLLDVTASYLRERVQFGSPLSDFQAIRHSIADIEIEVFAAQSALYRVGEMLDADSSAHVSHLAAIAKVYAAELYNRTATTCVRLMGGAGFVRTSEAQRHLRDSMVYVIGGGSSEIMRNVIARDILGPTTQRHR